MMKWLGFCLCLSLMILGSVSVASTAKCHGQFINPISHVDWSAMFPVFIAGVNIANPGKDNLTPDPFKSPLCACGSPVPRIGIPIGFWQPFRAADVTRKPYCMVNLGGMSLNLGIPTPDGDIANEPGGEGENQQTAFYHVHWYVYPLLSWMNFLTDILCLEHEDFDVAYLTELDPTWSDDEIGMWLTPESAIFANPFAQMACVADCAASTFGRSLSALPWCAGCQGGVYPVTGTLPFHNSGADASTLMVERMLFKLHREGLLWGSMGKEGICHKYPMPWWRKDQYKIQPVFPSINKMKWLKTNPVGRTTFAWGVGKEKNPLNGDWGYLVWRRKECCVW
jgi:conjugal transfer pilus assembly protein TraU